jgi:hypothetical protein
MATPVPVLPAQPAPAGASNVTLASNAGGGNWKTFAPGKMPLGRLIATGDLNDVADRGLAGERIYLKGPPAQGAVVNRDETRPYEITEVRKQEDGQLNVFVREIMQPN